MSQVRTLPIGSLGRRFVPGHLLPDGADEYHIRNEQSSRPADSWRPLGADEIEALVRNANVAGSWDDVLVSDKFSPHLVRACEFHGLVRIGRLEELYLEHHDLRAAVGLTHSRIVSCDIGDNVAIHHVRYLGHYILGDNVILLNLDEMHTTNYAKFGNGIVKDGEDESVRIWMDLVNEAGGRSVMPFDGMLPADAYLWAKYRDDEKLMVRLGEMTQEMFDSRRGFYGTVGNACVIKSCRIIKDVRVGGGAYIKGANKLKNLTINSSDAEPTQIGEGVELVNGIIGCGCHVFYGCKAVRFVMGDNSNLKYGARLIHSYLGDNSTVSCCEMLNNLVFPAHEQHHNNSFLIASLVMGQSNLAAAATIGSNHNSRAPDGEIRAGRGFWPGLCVSVKHNSCFASFTLLAKGDYAAELDIPLPFALVSNDPALNRLVILPAYWWLHNMYALARNTWKFGARDRRKRKIQKIEFDCLAPDTAEEMFTAMALLEKWTATAALRGGGGENEKKTPQELTAMGCELLARGDEGAGELEILGENIENSSRDVVILKAAGAWRAYRQMLHYYAVRNLLAYLLERPGATLASMCGELGGPRRRDWVNLGGQLAMREDVDRLRADIGSGRLADWTAVHEAYDSLWKRYPLDRQRHALATLLDLLGLDELTGEAWAAALDEVDRIQRYVADQTYETRKKDFDGAFRRITFDTPAEMSAVLGAAEDNSFVRQVREETAAFAGRVQDAKRRG